MARRNPETARFALLLAADAKLGEADEALRRAGLAQDCAKIAALRRKLARALQTLQGDAYDHVAGQRPPAT